LNQVKSINILEVSRGAVMEQIDIELRKIVENLADMNCDYKPARTLTIKVKFKNMDDKRDQVGMIAQASSTLVANNPISSMLYTETVDGQTLMAELNKPDPRQVSFEEEQGTATTNMINMAEAKKAKVANG
jgi:hypothetical protein